MYERLKLQETLAADSLLPGERNVMPNKVECEK
jgi:hypothetical protein